MAFMCNRKCHHVIAPPESLGCSILPHLCNLPPKMELNKYLGNFNIDSIKSSMNFINKFINIYICCIQGTLVLDQNPKGQCNHPVCWPQLMKV